MFKVSYCILFTFKLCIGFVTNANANATASHPSHESRSPPTYMSVSKSLPASTTQASTLLLCEALGFSPQILLDDIINIANNAVQDGVNGMEEFLEKWAEERASRGDTAAIDSTHEVEQGLVAFQTLLEHHTDIAFDFFEGWSLRNIFHIPPDLPIVLPHQEGLDLTVTSEREQELMNEMEDLRNQLDNVRFILLPFPCILLA